MAVRKEPKPLEAGETPPELFRLVAHLYRRRIKLGRTQEAVAADLGISSRQLGRYENLKSPVPVKMLESWARALGEELSITLTPRADAARVDA